MAFVGKVSISVTKSSFIPLVVYNQVVALVVVLVWEALTLRMLRLMVAVRTQM